MEETGRLLINYLNNIKNPHIPDGSGDFNIIVEVYLDEGLTKTIEFY